MNVNGLYESILRAPGPAFLETENWQKVKFELV